MEYSLVQLLSVQAVAFALSWCVAFAGGHRLRRGNPAVSLLWCVAVEAAAYALAGPPGGSPPAA